MLKSFKFASNGGGIGRNYKEPVAGAQLSTLMDATSNMYKADMAAAFKAAPPYLQAALCNLEKQTPVPGVFIDATGTDATKAPFAWSFWEVSNQNKGKGRYLAITAKASAQSSVVKDVQSLETFILSKLLVADPAHTYYGPVTVISNELPRVVTGQSPTNLALMAALAREVGFIVYMTMSIPNQRS